jgi:hypothetical protein
MRWGWWQFQGTNGHEYRSHSDITVRFQANFLDFLAASGGVDFVPNLGFSKIASHLYLVDCLLQSQFQFPVFSFIYKLVSSWDQRAGFDAKWFFPGPNDPLGGHQNHPGRMVFNRRFLDSIQQETFHYLSKGKSRYASDDLAIMVWDECRPNGDKNSSVLRWLSSPYPNITRGFKKRDRRLKWTRPTLSWKDRHLLFGKLLCRIFCREQPAIASLSLNFFDELEAALTTQLNSLSCRPNCNSRNFQSSKLARNSAAASSYSASANGPHPKNRLVDAQGVVRATAAGRRHAQRAIASVTCIQRRFA